MPKTRRVELVVDVALQGVRSALARDRIAGLARRTLRAEGADSAVLSITLVTPARMAMLNREHVGHRGATDVITLAFVRDRRRNGTAPLVADIYICPAVAARNARLNGERVRDEIARLVIHGVLHSLGWNHPERNRTKSPMWQRQERLLAGWRRSVAS